MAPASSAATARSYVASVWPIAATTPAACEPPDGVQPAGQLGREGDHPDVAARRPRAARRPAPASGSVEQGRVVRAGVRGLSHGPSRWMPASSPSSTSVGEARAPTRPAPSTRVGDQAGHHRGGAVGEVRARPPRPPRRADPPSNDAPPPPCACASTKPGHHGRRRAGRRPAGRGGAPGPTSAIRSPSTSTHPGAKTRAGVTTRPAEISMLRRSCPPRRPRLLVVVLAAGRPQVPLADHEPEQEVVEDGVAEPDQDQQQRLGRDVAVEHVVEQARPRTRTRP